MSIRISVKRFTWFSASTHTLPFHILARYLVSELDCEVALLCIQPAGNTVGAPLWPVVAEAVDIIVDTLVGKLALN